MPPVRFEPTISVRERPQTYALDRAATWTGIFTTWRLQMSSIWLKCIHKTDKIARIQEAIYIAEISVQMACIFKSPSKFKVSTLWHDFNELTGNEYKDICSGL
jgi:hypothetical protein